MKRDNEPVQGDFDTIVPWWSITKTVLASTVLKLVDEGKLSLENKYKDHTGTIKPYTIRQLLQHTAGLNTYGGQTYCAAVETGDDVWSVKELLKRARVDKLVFQPGKGWAYSNIGYLFIRLLIEETMQMEIGQALQHIVFEPMGISKTQIAKTPNDMRKTIWGHTTNYDPRWVYHGLLIGPPSDAVIFLNQILNKGFLSKSSQDAMREIYSIGGKVEGRPWASTGYGLGLMIGEMKDVGLAIGHSGAGHDSVSALYCFPDTPTRTIIAVFAQGADEGLTEHEAVRLALNVKGI